VSSLQETNHAQGNNCFSLAKNEEKRKAAGFEDGKFTKKKEE